MFLCQQWLVEQCDSDLAVSFSWKLSNVLQTLIPPPPSQGVCFRGVHTGGQTYLDQRPVYTLDQSTRQVCIACSLYRAVFGSHQPHFSI